MKVSDILRVKGGTLYTVSPEEKLSHAIETMAEFDIGSLAVMENGQLVGMLTFREILQALHRHERAPEEIQVGEVMVADPVTAFPEMEANELRRLMIDRHSRYLPVMDGETLQGVISFLDVAKAVLEEQSFENRMLKSYIKNWPGEGEAPAV